MKKQIIIPIVTALAGILVGFLIFGTDSGTATEQTTEKKDVVWTCSMHPQIRKDVPGDCPICGMDLIPLDNNSGDNPLVFEMSPDAMRIANIQTTTVGTGNQNSTGITLSGRLTSDETTASSIVSHIPGRIEKLYVSYTGDRVYAGQKIASIYAPKLISAQGELIEAFKIRDSHPELLEAAKNKLRFWKISNAEINSIIKNQRVKEVFDIQAEHSGVIHKRRINVGDHLMGGSVLFDLQNLNSLWAVFDVYEKDLGSVKVGDEISFTTPALTGQTFTSKVVFINPVINPATRTADVRLEVSNSKKMLKPDMFVTGVLHSTNNESRDQLFVPKSAVLWTGVSSVVYVKLPGTDIPSFEFREILLGRSYGKLYEVLEGLKTGEEVVTNGAFVIDASAQLNNRSSMMNRNLLGIITSNSAIRTPDYSQNASLQFRLQLKAVLSAYLGMKDAFVASEDVGIKKFAKELEQKLDEVDMKLLNGEAHMYWMEKSKEITGAIKQIHSGKNIDAQRANFDELSIAVISSAQAYGLYDENLYVQYCPMADNDKGAYWLSKEYQIRNPYFGDQMLTCGEVKDSIRKRNKRTVNPAPMQGHNH